jgi:hypothetical protein
MEKTGRDDGTNGNNGTNGKVSIINFPFVPSSLLLHSARSQGFPEENSK